MTYNYISNTDIIYIEEFKRLRSLNNKITRHTTKRTPSVNLYD